MPAASTQNSSLEEHRSIQERAWSLQPRKLAAENSSTDFGLFVAVLKKTKHY
jgi:hypothetical protein